MGLPTGKEFGVEAISRFRGVAWLAVALFACGFCYSLGFQSGWVQATGNVEVRMTSINQALERIMNSTPQPADLPPEALQAAGHEDPLPAG